MVPTWPGAPGTSIGHTILEEVVLPENGYSLTLSALSKYGLYLEAVGALPGFTCLSPKALPSVQESKAQIGEQFSPLAGRILLRQAKITDLQKEMVVKNRVLKSFEGGLTGAQCSE